MKKLILYTSSIAGAAILLNCGQDAEPTDNGDLFVTPAPGAGASGTPSGGAATPTPSAMPGGTPGATPGVTAMPGMPTPGETTPPTGGPTPVDPTPGAIPVTPALPADDGAGGADTGGGEPGAGGTPVTPVTPVDDGMGGSMVMEPVDPMPAEPMCGNGMVEGTEACDDGNVMPGDGCEPDCTATPEAPAVTIETLVPDLDGHLVTTPCGDQPQSDDCAGGGWSINGGQLNVCQNGQLSMDVSYDVGGEPGVTYDVTMHFYGVMEPRQYNQVQRDAMGASNRDEGGVPTPWAWAQPGANYRSAGDNNYNTYEIPVYDEHDQEQQMYFLNSDSGYGHYTMAINYEKTIPIVGGGRVQLIVYDANCRMIKNCGASGSPGGGQCSEQARSIDISAADPQPSNLQQPGLGNPPAHSGQWWLIDVVDVQEAAQ